MTLISPSIRPFKGLRPAPGQAVAAASMAAYDVNQIRKYEFTRPDKEDDRVRQIEALNAETGPVFVTHKSNAEVRAIMEKAAAATPLYDVTADTGVRHQRWRIDAADEVARLSHVFDKIGVLDIADGHHRSASASGVAATRRGKGNSGSAEHFLAVSFPRDELKILDYNRTVADANQAMPPKSTWFEPNLADGLVSHVLD